MKRLGLVWTCFLGAGLGMTLPALALEDFPADLFFPDDAKTGAAASQPDAATSRPDRPESTRPGSDRELRQYGPLMRPNVGEKNVPGVLDPGNARETGPAGNPAPKGRTSGTPAPRSLPTLDIGNGNGSPPKSPVRAEVGGSRNSEKGESVKFAVPSAPDAESDDPQTNASNSEEGNPSASSPRTVRPVPSALPETSGKGGNLQLPRVRPNEVQGRARVSRLTEDGLPSEVVRERYTSGAVKIERYVTMDAARNYVNHGKWSYWDEEGTLMSQGEYLNGHREGEWARLFPETPETKAEDAKPFSEGYAHGFERPLISRAIFRQGKLNGTWAIHDVKERMICAWNFQDDLLHGTQIWWYPNGKKRREVNFQNGVLQGLWSEWSVDGTEVKKETFVDGRRKARTEETYPSGERYAQGWLLHSDERITVTHDWWEAVVKFQSESVDTKKQQPNAVKQPLKDGHWTYWHRNGSRLSEGNFANGLPVGEHGWWFENGQKKAEGAFVSGQRHGRWTWWHENGQKFMEGVFATGDQMGQWFSWAEDGKLTSSMDYGSPQSRQKHSFAADESPAGGPRRRGVLQNTSGSREANSDPFQFGDATASGPSAVPRAAGGVGGGDRRQPGRMPLPAVEANAMPISSAGGSPAARPAGTEPPEVEDPSTDAEKQKNITPGRPLLRLQRPFRWFR